MRLAKRMIGLFLAFFSIVWPSAWPNEVPPPVLEDLGPTKKKYQFLEKGVAPCFFFDTFRGPFHRGKGSGKNQFGDSPITRFPRVGELW